MNKFGKHLLATSAAVCALGLIGGKAASAADLPSAQQPPQSASQSAPMTSSTSPQKNPHSQELAERGVLNERAKAVRKATSKPVSEAISAIDETRTAVKALDQGNSAQANAALERAAGKLDIVLAEHPRMALAPISSDVSVVDLVTDDATVKAIGGQAKAFIDHGQFQAARRLLRNFASEIDITSVYIPMAGYPVAIQSAAGLIREKKLKGARDELVGALSSLVISSETIPLPTVKAAALVDEVHRQVSQNQVNKTDADRLLTDANDQLKLAEDLGYQVNKDEFADMRNQIANVKTELGKTNSSTAFTKVKSDLESLETKISRSPASE